MSVYPCVAAKDYLNTLPASARACSNFKKQIEEEYDIIWKACGKHAFHYECIKAADRPLMGICDCVVNHWLPRG